MTVGGDDNLYLAGYADGPIDLGGGELSHGGGRDVFIAKLSLDGAHLYSRLFPAATGNQTGTAISATTAGEVWLGVEFEGQMDLGLGALQTQGNEDFAVAKYAPAP